MTDEETKAATERSWRRAAHALTEFVQNGLSVNADRICHLTDLNTAAYKKYGTIAEANKIFSDKITRANEQCRLIANQLEMLDKVMEKIDDMEKKVADLDAIVSSLEEKIK